MKTAILLVTTLVILCQCKSPETAAAPIKAQPAPVAVASEEPIEKERPLPEAPPEIDPQIINRFGFGAYPDTLLFRLERTACFGQCPIYWVEVYQSGYARLHARRFADWEGSHTAKLSEQQMQEIVQLAMETNYGEFNNSYDGPVTDLPSTITLIQTPEVRNWVYNRMKGPDQLIYFERSAEAIIKAQTWKPHAPFEEPPQE